MGNGIAKYYSTITKVAKFHLKSKLSSSPAGPDRNFAWGGAHKTRKISAHKQIKNSLICTLLYTKD
jgi:hypothetical protein